MLEAGLETSWSYVNIIFGHELPSRSTSLGGFCHQSPGNTPEQYTSPDAY